MAVSDSAPPRARRPTGSCLLVRDDADLAAHFDVRHHVFVEQQRLFRGTDRDAHDGEPSTRHAIGVVGDRVAGAVRLYPLDDDGLWKGDRLAVLRDERYHQLGALLVCFAVATAGELGGRRMIAQIQLPNVRFFERLGWARDGEPAPAYGVVHQPMAIALSAGR